MTATLIVWQDMGIAPAWPGAAHTLTDTEYALGDDDLTVYTANEGTTGGSAPTFVGDPVIDNTVEWQVVFAWEPESEYDVGNVVQPTAPNSHWYQAIDSVAPNGSPVSGTSEPDWPTDGGTVDDVGDDGVFGGSGSTATERIQYYDVWSWDDLLGDAIGTLTEAEKKNTRAADNMPGYGSFQINRNSEQFADLCTVGNLIRVRIDSGGPYAYDSENYKVAFFIEEGDDEIVSPEEEGGEIVQMGGRTAERILEDALIDFEPHFVDDLDDVYTANTASDNQWTFDSSIVSSAGTPGTVMRVLLRNAGAMSPSLIPDVTHDFTTIVDSNGDPWDLDDGAFYFNVGTNLLEALATLVEGGLWYRFTPALLLRCWDESQGQNLTGAVVFAKGLNVRESGSREIHGKPAKSRVLVHGASKKGINDWRWVNSSAGTDHYDDLSPDDTETAIGARAGFLEYPNSPTDGRLDLAGQKRLVDLKNWHDGTPTVGVLDVEGMEAFVDYFPGDTVNVTLPDVPSNAVVHAISLVDNDTGSYDPSVEFVGETWSESSPTVQATTPVAREAVGYSSIGNSTQAPDMPDIPIAQGQIALVWWRRESGVGSVDIVPTGGAVESSFANGFRHVTGSGTFSVVNDDGDPTSAIHVIVLPLGYHLDAEGS